jgi:hypothetical protein
METSEVVTNFSNWLSKGIWTPQLSRTWNRPKGWTKILAWPPPCTNHPPHLFVCGQGLWKLLWSNARQRPYECGGEKRGTHHVKKRIFNSQRALFWDFKQRFLGAHLKKRFSAISTSQKGGVWWVFETHELHVRNPTARRVVRNFQDFQCSKSHVFLCHLFAFKFLRVFP